MYLTGVSSRRKLTTRKTQSNSQLLPKLKIHSFRRKRAKTHKKIRFTAPYSLRNVERKKTKVIADEFLKQFLKRKRSSVDLVAKEIEKKTEDKYDYEMIAKSQLRQLKKLQIFVPEFKAKEKNKKFRAKYLSYLKIRDRLKTYIGEENPFN